MLSLEMLFVLIISLLWPNLLPSFVGSKKSLQVPHSSKPIFIASFNTLDLLYFAVVSISS